MIIAGTLCLAISGIGALILLTDWLTKKALKYIDGKIER